MTPISFRVSRMEGNFFSFTLVKREMNHATLLFVWTTDKTATSDSSAFLSDFKMIFHYFRDFSSFLFMT